ncbi:MAG: AAA family ATPase [Thermodesulfobacteriota bacterium]
MKRRSSTGRQPRQPVKGIAESAVPYRASAKLKRPYLRFACFEITNFRCFRSLEIKPMNRVNLITGLNGVGKTTILEALFLHIGHFNPSLALRVNVWRGFGTVEDWSGMLWRTLFWQFREAEPIRFVGTDSLGKKRVLSITVTPSASALPQDVPSGMGVEFARDLGRDLVLEYRDERGTITKVRGVPEVVRRGSLVEYRLRAEPPVGKSPVPGIFLNSWRQGPSEEEVQRFSELRIRNQDEIVLDVLRYMEPRLERLEILSPQGTSMIHGHLKGYDEPVPLSLLGDGVRRVASLVLAIGWARGGILLVDEIENGIHHSVMKPLWEAIGRAAEMFETQVIATTHSLECISAALEAFTLRRSFDLALHRIDRTDGTVRAIGYDRESLEGALSIPLEVRG